MILAHSRLHHGPTRLRSSGAFITPKCAILSFWGGENRASRLALHVWTFLRKAASKAAGDFMANQVQLSEEDVTYLLTVLRNSSQPITTQQLINALRDRAK